MYERKLLYCSASALRGGVSPPRYDRIRNRRQNTSPNPQKFPTNFVLALHRSTQNQLYDLSSLGLVTAIVRTVEQKLLLGFRI
jgi:hypothetical protein